MSAIHYAETATVELQGELFLLTCTSGTEEQRHVLTMHALQRLSHQCNIAIGKRHANQAEIVKAPRRKAVRA